MEPYHNAHPDDRIEAPAAIVRGRRNRKLVELPSGVAMEPRDLFLSYVEEDGPTARTLAAELRALGRSTWTYQDDGVAGFSYLAQGHAAIEACRAFVLIASARSVHAHQVIREVEQAHEQEKIIIVVRLGLTHREFVVANPILRVASGTAVTLEVIEGRLGEIAKRIDTSIRFAPGDKVAVGERPQASQGNVSHGRVPLSEPSVPPVTPRAGGSVAVEAPEYAQPRREKQLPRMFHVAILSGLGVQLLWSVFLLAVGIALRDVFLLVPAVAIFVLTLLIDRWRITVTGLSAEVRLVPPDFRVRAAPFVNAGLAVVAILELFLFRPETRVEPLGFFILGLPLVLGAALTCYGMWVFCRIAQLEKPTTGVGTA
jgi:hypothetical protein